MRTREQVVDDLLVLAAQGGDLSAFERLALRWHPRLLRHARRLAGDDEGAREAVQDAWVAIVRGLGRLRDPARFGPWALRITARRCADWIASRRLVRDRTAAGDAADTLPSTTSRQADDVVRIRDAYRRLKRGDRILVAMFYREGFTVREIAEVFGVPAGTIKSRLFHARERLRATMEVSHDRQDRS